MNSGIKVIFVIYFLVIGFIVTVEVQSVYTAREEIKKALIIAVDSGIIHGTVSGDTGRGDVRLDETRVRQGVVSVLRKNLNLDETLSSDAFRKGRLEVKVTHNSNGVPRVEAVYRGTLRIGIMRLVGMDGYEIEVPKRTPYLTEYK
ncbi:hypothetical protein WJ0W_007116 [Paenibacillus melissococcoides]|uniref:Uncharacterized protein n=1 Tax=Paenibacillus melissococcoides TaxID=2912268 RepID=A0ABN8UBE3_9BACL|nr:hypothetical protein [Paenibacillus melissococcoides]CAH8248448.1 hypothetical protein WJ0W_007116 [Paenibacillus melissococcoides]CAH8722063.1 hypothetical protein HTL2_006674 [Paenibacillus melissococcoides]CAH8722087.1 hypothetical protein WDD9_006613 [Paenibacillus melissococcoides]